MRIHRKSRLHYELGRSRKVYEVDLVELDSHDAHRFVVNFRYGRRDGRLRESTKTVDPVTRAEADDVFDSVVVSKLNRGYVETLDEHALPEAAEQPRSDAAVTAPEQDAPEPIRRLLSRLEEAAAGRLDDKAATRALWRAGEWGIFDAGEIAARLVGRRGPIMDYCAAFAIGRSGNSAAAQALERLWQKKSRSAAGLLAREALLDIGDETMRLGVQNAARAELPSRLGHAIDQAEEGVFFDELNRLLDSPTPQTPDTLIDLYTLAKDNESIHRALLHGFADVETKPNLFRALRKIFKHAEYRFDGDMFGILANRFELCSAGYHRDAYSGSHVSIPGSYEYVRLAKEVARPDSRLAFSNRTKAYFRRRVWRTLRRLGQQDKDEYARMACGVLLAFNDNDAAEPLDAERYDGFADALAFNHILRERSPTHSLSASRRIWQVTGDASRLPRGRIEAFPEIWDRQPDLLLALLERSGNRLVHEFASLAIGYQKSFLDALPVERLAPLLSSLYECTVSLAFDALKSRFDARQPGAALLIAFVNAGAEDVRRFAQDWIDGHREYAAGEPAVLFALLTNHHAQIRAWSRTVIPAHALNEDGAQALVARLIAWLLAVPAPSADNESEAASQDNDGHGSDGGVPDARIDDIGWALTDLFAATTGRLGDAVIDDLFAHRRARVRLQGARLVARRNITEHAEVSRWLGLALEDPDSAVRAVGVQVLGGLPDETLLELAELVASLAVAEAPEVRHATRPLVERLAQTSADFAQRLCDTLVGISFRSETFEGLHDDTLELLKGPLDTTVQELDTSMVWRLLHARSKGAQRLGEYLVLTRSPDEFSVRQIARLAMHAFVAVRRWAQQAFNNQVDRIRADAEHALKILDAPWDDTRVFAFDYFAQNFTEDDWTPDRIVAICDSVREDVQEFGRELMAGYYSSADGELYLMRLAEHPSQNVELYVTQLLNREATENPARMEALKPYFATVLSRVNRGRAAKSRVFSFLRQQAATSPEIARTVLELLERLSATAMVEDRGVCVAAMRDICAQYPQLQPPFTVRSPRPYAGRRQRRAEQSGAQSRGGNS